MEKKRRARINKCLDQLKTLLESYYTSNIRKRKLEKADILELTVKHLRSLQKIQSCSSKASGFSDYQAGFTSCLANVHQYLSLVDHVHGNVHDSVALSQLVSKHVYACAQGEREASSTSDSDAGKQAAAREGARPADRRRTADRGVLGVLRGTRPQDHTSTGPHGGTLQTGVKAEGQSLVLRPHVPGPHVPGPHVPGPHVPPVLPSHTRPSKGFKSLTGPNSPGTEQSMWRPW
ncbi:unnamed protein product [Merluccius merluccius]